MSWWPYIVLLVATRCLYWGYIWLSTVFSIACFRMSRWPDVVLLLATRCLYWRVCPTVYCILNCMLQNVMMTLHSTACGHQMPLLGVPLTVHCILNCLLQNVKMTWCSTALGHQMPLLEGMSNCLLHSQLHASECHNDPYIVLLVATRCLY